MRSSYENRVVERVKQLTGLTGESLNFVTGAAIATATIGKYPTKVDMSSYLGMTEGEMDRVSHKAAVEAWESDVFPKWLDEAEVESDRKAKHMIYAVATDMVANNYLMDVSDSDGKARLFLNTMFYPQQINGHRKFAGFLIVLEYLRHRDRGLDSPLTQFLKMRYGNYRVYDNLSAFCEVVANNDPESFPQNDYGFVIGRLRELLEISD